MKVSVLLQVADILILFNFIVEERKNQIESHLVNSNKTVYICKQKIQNDHT